MFSRAQQITVAIVCTIILALPISAQESSPIVAIEEDWEVTILEPDPDTGSPQIATQMKPNKDSDSVYAIFCVNYQEVPDFIEGGLEIQLWNEDWVVDIDGKSGYSLSIDEETIQWTQYLKIYNGWLHFGVKQGESRTYGEFGGYFFRVYQNTGLTNLGNYSPDTSARDSAVSLGANRVRKLHLKEVRYYHLNGTMTRDTNLRVIVADTATGS